MTLGMARQGFLFLFSFLVLFSLLFFFRSAHALKHQLHLIGLLIRMLIGVGLDVTVHKGGTRFDELLLLELLFGILTPVNRFRFLVPVIV